MLKFSGYPYLIRGQPWWKIVSREGRRPGPVNPEASTCSVKKLSVLGVVQAAVINFRRGLIAKTKPSNTKPGLEG